MTSITFEHSQGPIPNPEQENLAWLQHPAIQDALQCLQWPMAQADSNDPQQVADFFGYKSQEILRTAEELKRQSTTGEPTLEEATELHFVGSMLAGLGSIIKNPEDITWLQSLIEQSKDNNTNTAIVHESAEEEAATHPETVEAEPAQDEISLTGQVIQTMVVNENLAASEIEAMVESVSAFRNGWVMGVVEELMAGADTMGKATAVDKLTELYFGISNELRLNRNRIDDNDCSLAPNEIKVLRQANTILQVAERVFIDLAARINRTGDIKKCVIAVMEVEVEELRTQARAILEGPAFTTKQEMDWARQTLEVLKTGMPEEAYQNTSNPQVIGMDEQEAEPSAAIEDGNTVSGMPEMVEGGAQARFSPVVEKPSFVQSITLGGGPVKPVVAAEASSEKKHDVSETKHGGLDAPVVILTPEIRKSLIDIALALGDDEAGRIARKAQHSSEEIELLKAMAHRAHLLKKEREDASEQNSGRPDIVERAKALSSYVGPLRGRGA